MDEAVIEELVAQKQAEYSAAEEKYASLIQRGKEDLEQLLAKQGAIAPEEKQFTIDRLDLVSRNFQSGNFAFWGGILKPGFPKSPAIRSEFVGIIKNLRVPIRGEGLGTKVVRTWEKGLSSGGIRTFLVTNVEQEAIKFWEGLGYQIPEEERLKPIPYYMVKTA